MAKTTEQKIIELKAEIFDIMFEQDRLQVQQQKLVEMRDEKLRELFGLMNNKEDKQ